MKHCRLLAACLAAACVILAAPSGADTGTSYNRVHLIAQQSAAVGNDSMHVTMTTFGESRNPEQLAAGINTEMEWALAAARTYGGIVVATRNYQTYPVYKDNKLQTWRGQQELVLEGKDTEQLGRLVAQLQERLQVKSMRFSVSDARRADTENRLIDQALNAFKERAAIVMKNLKASSYRIVDISISTSAKQPPIPYQGRVMAMAAETAVAVEAGESEVEVTASGIIELQIP